MRLYSTSSCRSDSVSSRSFSSLAPDRDLYMSQDDLNVLKSKFQFIRDDDADAEQGETDWQIRMSVRYYQQLFREYALADLSRYAEGKIGLRWRTEAEVVAGKGQFICGNKRCDERTQLHSYELLFAYVEHGKRKRCFVKVRVCSTCAAKLFHKKLNERRKETRAMERRGRKRCRMEKESDGEESDKQHTHPASRIALSTSDKGTCGDADKQTEAGSKVRVELGADTDPDIHEVCAAINAEQNASYPRSLCRRSGGFDELLP
ncbi:unnamed protein product [Hyaloperonospora brassicae]|uniref:Protein FRA10AC1 n=1 Tax=Hyaloperonospora brassicae TaxID=162125 RepID=A0AAV0TKM7_HYABA|nr:unnamed protein product [Hyaloperonospora brassicae]